MWGLSSLLQAMLPSWGIPGNLGSPGNVEVPQGCGWSQAGSRPQCHRQEAEV